jgi:DnaJ-class molecular chaperone
MTNPEQRDADALAPKCEDCGGRGNFGILASGILLKCPSCHGTGKTEPKPNQE